MQFVQEFQSRRIVRTLRAYPISPAPATSSNFRKLPKDFSQLLSRANIDRSVVERLLACSLAMALIVGVCLGALAALAISVTIGAATALFIRSSARRREKELDRDLPTLLTSIASSVRAGLDPLSALLVARNFFPKGSVVCQALGEMTLRCGAGVSEEEVIEEWLRDFNNSDVELFKECLILARRQGSPLAEPLHRVARVVRQRQAFRRKATTALAMHRMSAIGIALCAVAIGAIQVAMNPQGIEVAIHHKSGARFLVGGVLFMIAGLGWMLRIGAREEVR